MKLTFALLAASLAALVSAKAYQLCCCVKPDEQKIGGRVFQVGTPKCQHDATKAAADTKPGDFMFTTHEWIGDGYGPEPPYAGSNYIYATGANNQDNKIGAKEMAKLCKAQGAGQACWSPGDAYSYNYKGEYCGSGYLINQTLPSSRTNLIQSLPTSTTNHNLPRTHLQEHTKEASEQEWAHFW
ncbi:hypothetical protein Vi05172_g13501 [Venturia inaequalis]|nr:hypothetical protein Vi05172_g13501 [Venturia inaequalis]